LNVRDEALPNFFGIVPCGIADGGVTSMERVCGRRPALIEAVPPLVANFGDVFGREIIAP
jgi:lipoate-protein ligase B